MRHRAQLLVSQAEAQGLVLTIEQIPLRPLAAGHYRAEVSVRQARVRAEPRHPFDLDDACRAAMERLTTSIDEAVNEARHDHAVEGVLARMAMEERHHGPRGASGASWNGLGVSYRPMPGESIIFTVGGGGGGAPAGGGAAWGGNGERNYGFWCASCQESNRHLRGCQNVRPGEPVVGGPL